MIVLGIDSGSHETAWAALRASPRGGRPAFVACGMVPSNRPRLRALLAREPHDRLAIEFPGLVFVEEAASHLVQAAWWGGVVYGATPLPIEHVLLKTAVEIRSKLGVGRSPTDAQVGLVVRNNIFGLPRLTNNHERDAMAVALVHLWMLRTGEKT